MFIPALTYTANLLSQSHFPALGEPQSNPFPPKPAMSCLLPVPLAEPDSILAPIPQNPGEAHRPTPDSSAPRSLRFIALVNLAGLTRVRGIQVNPRPQPFHPCF